MPRLPLWPSRHSRVDVADVARHGAGVRSLWAPSPTTALTPSSSSSSGFQAEVPHERADAELRARARAADSLPLGRLPLFQFLFLSPRTGDSGCGITEDQPAEHALRLAPVRRRWSRLRAAPRRKFSVLATLASAEVLGGGLLAAALRALHPCVGLVAAAPGFLEAVPDLCGDGVGGKMGQQQLSGGEGPLEILDLLDCLEGLHEFSHCTSGHCNVLPVPVSCRAGRCR